MYTHDEKYLLSILFKNKLFYTHGEEFENLFASIMKSKYGGQFTRVKPWGRQGDKKNDGCFLQKKILYQVYGPEDLAKSQNHFLIKLKEDSKGAKEHWSDIKEFYFVVNDKYQGIPPKGLDTIQKIQKELSLENAGFITSEDLELWVFSLDQLTLMKILGHIPSFENLHKIKLEALRDIIVKIMKSPLGMPPKSYIAPDWNEKIIFNNISDYTKILLDSGAQQIFKLDKILSTHPFSADQIQEKITALYLSIKEKSEGNDRITGDNIFWQIVSTCCPEQISMYQIAMMPIMAKYFESCDIFENPK